MNPSALTRQTKAAVAWEAGKDLSIEDIEVEAPKAHEVRIEVYYTGVCHTGMSCFRTSLSTSPLLTMTDWLVGWNEPGEKSERKERAENL